MSYVEIEATLAICSEAPESIADEVADLTAIGPYQLRSRPELAIRDVYVDLADHALRSRGLGLRLRLIDGCQLVTLKGATEKVVGGGRRREEIELVWSVDALHVIVARIADFDLVLEPVPSVGQWSDPLAVLSQMGFSAEQTRNTRRKPRDVFKSGDSISVLAELVVDSVAYHFLSGEVRHYEVEIEVKGEGGIVAMQDISKELLSRWPAMLRLWDHGKRSTGAAVEALIGERGRTGIVANTGDLLPEAYDLIASHLR